MIKQILKKELGMYYLRFYHKLQIIKMFNLIKNQLNLLLICVKISLIKLMKVENLKRKIMMVMLRNIIKIK